MPGGTAKIAHRQKSLRDPSWQEIPEMATQVKVLFFASAREVVGQESIPIELEENSTISSLETILVAMFPNLSQCDLRFAVNRKYVSSECSLSSGDEVACLPPVSGG